MLLNPKPGAPIDWTVNTLPGLSTLLNLSPGWISAASPVEVVTMVPFPGVPAGVNDHGVPPVVTADCARVAFVAVHAVA